jgi:hypothetical protein
VSAPETSSSSLTLVCLRKRAALDVFQRPWLSECAGRSGLGGAARQNELGTRGLSLLSLQLSLDAFVNSGRNREANPQLPMPRPQRHAAG